jgi:hypothetical protein
MTVGSSASYHPVDFSSSKLLHDSYSEVNRGRREGIPLPCIGSIEELLEVQLARLHLLNDPLKLWFVLYDISAQIRLEEER